MVCRSGVNGILIGWFAADGTSSECQTKIAELLQVTGAYSISGMCRIGLSVPIKHTRSNYTALVVPPNTGHKTWHRSGCKRRHATAENAYRIDQAY